MNSTVKLGKILYNIIFYTIAFIFIIFLFLMIFFSIVNKEKIPSFFNYYVLEVVSGSMEPKIEVGDFILVKKEDSYKVGDIVTYKVNDYFVTHRIVSIKGNTVITKGDANNSNDEPFQKEDILGKFIVSSVLLGFIMKYRFIILFIIFLLYLIWKLISYILFLEDKNSTTEVSINVEEDIDTLKEEKQPSKNKYLFVEEEEEII